MKPIYRNLWIFFAVAVIQLISGCKGDSVPNPPDDGGGSGGGGTARLSYGDSIFYVRNSSYTINPVPTGRAGKFYAWPEGLELNNNTGAIEVNSSETGLRYKVMFVPDGTRDTISTKIVLSGVNYQDHYHVQTANDSLSRPFYNANFSQFTLPAGCSFDVGGSARADGLAIDPVTGVINVNQSIRNGFFGHIPARDGDKKELTVYYKIPDASGNATNKINVKLYFYNDISSVESDITQLLSDRTDMFFRMSQNIFEPPLSTSTAHTLIASRPRPPCVIILGH